MILCQNKSGCAYGPTAAVRVEYQLSNVDKNTYNMIIVLNNMSGFMQVYKEYARDCFICLSKQIPNIDFIMIILKLIEFFAALLKIVH